MTDQFRPSELPANVVPLRPRAERHRFHDTGDCFPGCPAWNSRDAAMKRHPSNHLRTPEGGSDE